EARARDGRAHLGHPPGVARLDERLGRLAGDGAVRGANFHRHAAGHRAHYRRPRRSRPPPRQGGPGRGHPRGAGPARRHRRLVRRVEARHATRRGRPGDGDFGAPALAVAGSLVVWKRATPQGEGAQATATLAPVPSPSPSAPPRATTAEAPTAAVPAIASAAPIAALLPSAEPSPTVPAPARGVGTARPVATASPPKRKPVPQAVATVAPTAPTAPSEPPAAKCDPPYYFDANGNRIFKKECL